MKPKDLFIKSENVLVRGLNWIGDAVMSLPVLHKLREAMSEARITVLAPTWCSDVYRICPAVDDIFEAPEKEGPGGFISEVDTATSLGEMEFDSCLILPNSFRSAIAPFIAHIPQRYGYKTDGRTVLLTDGIALDRRHPTHTVLYYKPLMENLLGIPWEEGTERFDMEFADTDLAASNAILQAKGVDLQNQLIGFNPGTAWGASKRWPAGHFAKAATALCQSGDRQALFFGSPKEKDLVSGVVAEVNAPSANLAGAFPLLRHLAAAIGRCSLLVTNDSGPMHIAAAMGVPVVALFGPTDERVSGPWTKADGLAKVLRAPGCEPCYNPDCRKQKVPCLSLIRPEEAVNAAVGLLAGVENRGRK